MTTLFQTSIFKRELQRAAFGKLLLGNSARNIDMNTKTSYGWTAFLRACENGHTEAVKLLLHHSELNIELNARDDFGDTALLMACNKKNTQKLSNCF